MRNRAALGTLALLLATGAGVAANGQDHPESLLPPGFDEPTAPAPRPSPTQGAPVPGGIAPVAPLAPVIPGDTAVPEAPLLPPEEPGADPGANETAAAPAPVDLSKYELPPFARRSLLRVGAASPASQGLEPDAFGRADGRYLEVLMRRLDAPIASRWLSIALRRMLLSKLDTPVRVNGADFAAERAWLLLRMGESVAARAVVQSVDVDRATPKLLQVAMQAELATGDVAGVCPMADRAQRFSADRAWVLAQAMCAGLGGKPNEAGQGIDAARKHDVATGIDLLLAEKVAGSGAQGRRAVTIDWGGVDRLTPWRFGLAAATGVAVPDDLLADAPARVRYWQALLPGAAPEARADAAEQAAAQGVFSNAALVDLYGEIEDADDSGEAAEIARDLRAAYTEADAADRLKALHQLWDQPDSARGKYARLVLTARAAATVPVRDVPPDDQARLVAAMLSAGLEGQAVRWAGAAERGSDAWALLALGDPFGATVRRGDVDSYASRVDGRKARVLLAGLAGLGRLAPGDAERLARSLDVSIGTQQNPWTWAIDAAAQRDEPATVVLLAAVGMQTRSWQGVAPEALFHIVAALRQVGLESYARMIAVEALSRM